MSGDLDYFSDDSENAALLGDTVLINRNQQSFEVKQDDELNKSRNESDAMPAGKKFILKAANTTRPSRLRCKYCIGWLLCLSSVFSSLSWLLSTDEHTGSIIAGITLLLLFIFFLFLVAVISTKIFMQNLEQWDTYMVILNVECNRFYIIDQSSRQKWKISCIGCMSDFRLKIESKSKDESFVMVEKTKINLRSVSCTEAHSFVEMIDAYLRKMRRQTYIQQQSRNGDVLAIDMDGEKHAGLDHQHGIDDEKELSKAEQGLKALIAQLMTDEDIIRQMDGQRLNAWYQQKRIRRGLLKLYKRLYHQRDAERKRFEKYMNFEPQFTDEYIAKMMLAQCNVFEILSDNE